MVKLLTRRLFCSVTAASMIFSAFSAAVFADDTFLNKSENFENFNVGDDWKTGLPSGWKLVSYGDNSSTEVKIVQDPTDSSNKVLKLRGVSKEKATGQNGDRLILYSNSGNQYVPKADKKIIVEARCYIDGETTDGLPFNGSDGRDRAILAGLAKDSDGGTFTVSNMRRESQTSAEPIVYARSGRYPSDYYAETNTRIATDRWVNVVHVITSHDDGSCSYRQYIDGKCISVSQKNGDITNDLRFATYDGSPDSSKLANAYGMVLSVVSDKYTEEGKEPTVYFDDVRMFETDKSDKLVITGATSADKLASFNTDEDIFNIEFSAALLQNALTDKIYIMDAEGIKKKVSGITLSADGKSAEISLRDIKGFKPGTDYTLYIDKGISDVNYTSPEDDFILNFTTKAKLNPIPDPTPENAAAVVKLYIDNDLEEYTVGDDWLSKTPNGWTVNTYSGQLEDAEVRIAEDPVDSNNKCVKVTPGHIGAKRGERVSVMANTSVDIAASNGKKLITKVKMYIKPDSAVGLSKRGEEGLDSTSLCGIALNNAGTSVFSVSTIRREGSENTPYLYARTGSYSSDWYADKMIELPVGRWFEITHVVDIADKGDGAAYPTYWYKQYIDGKPTVLTYGKQDGKPQTTDLNRNTYAGQPFASGYFSNYYGIINQIAVSPEAKAAPEVYFDDFYAAVVEDYSYGLKSDTDNVDPYAEIELEFPNAFDDANSELVKKAVSVEKVLYDDKGDVVGYEPIDGDVSVSTADNKVFKIKSVNGLEYNSYYCVQIKPENVIAAPLSIVDTFYQCAENKKIMLRTKKAKSAYIDLENGHLNLNGAKDLSAASKIDYRMRIVNPDKSDTEVIAACAVYGNSNRLKSILYKTVKLNAEAYSNVDFGFEDIGENVKEIGLFVFKKSSDGGIAGLMQVPDILR